MNKLTQENIDYTNTEGDIIEPFCGACMAVPLAFVGVGASAYGSKKGSHKKHKRIVFYIGIITAILSIMIAFYYLFLSDCSECR